MTKTVEEWVIDQASAGEHDLSSRRLFVCFCAHARKRYQYSATKIEGNEGNTLLARPDTEIVTVDCASLADALVELINRNIEGEEATREHVLHGMGFATQARSRCFDTRVVGNIRKPGETWAATGRCMFLSHYFVESGNQTRMCYDPCMFTTYATRDEVMSWKFDDAGGPFYHKVKFVVGNPEVFLVRVPDAHPAPKPVGFTGGWLQFNLRDLSRDDKRALLGRRGSGWESGKYEGKAASAEAKINQLLRERAGINVPI